MFRCPVRTDARPRLKKGRPAQTTTGVASANSIQAVATAIPIRHPNRCPPMSSSSRGKASAAPTQSRRIMSASSWFGGASAVISRGSSAMPQIGQLPGPTRRISGSIGQV